MAKLKLITGEVVLPGPRTEPIVQGALVIEGERIVEVGRAKDLMDKFPEAHLIDRPTGLILPGLINCHTHAPMVLFRGMADDLPLNRWLEEYIFPAEAKLNPDLIELGTLLACAEMIRSGTTTFVDMYFFEEQMASIVDRIGLRFFMGEGIFDFPSPAFASADLVMEQTVHLAHSFGEHPRLGVTVDPHTPYTCSQDILIKARDLAQKEGLPMVIHLAETKWEYDKFKEEKGLTPVQYLDKLGLLSPNLMAVHCVWLDQQDIDLLAKHQVTVVHCPESNLKLGSGICPVSKLLEAGVNVALGTDGAASNNDLDMLTEMDFAAKLPKGIEHDPTKVDAETVFEMATVNGAKALGLTDLGRLEPGYLADLIIIDLNRPHLRPCYNPVSHLVYAAKSGDVTDTMVAGQFVMKQGKLVNIDEEALLSLVKSFRHQLLGQEVDDN